MKTKIPFLLSLVLIASMAFSCKSKVRKGSSEPAVSIQNHISDDFSFPAEGVYYSYNFPDNTPYDYDEKAIISLLSESGIQPLDVWYKPGSSMCVPPGSDMGMTVIVEPALLVRLKKASDAMSGLGFTVPEEPNVGSCAYYVRHYKY